MIRILLLIVSIGRLTPVKNFELLILLVHSLNQKGVKARLLIVGEGDHRSALEELAREHHIEELVSLPGFSDKPTNEIAHGDIYIQPSFSEGFGISVAEAMMLGLPVVGSSVGGIQDIITENVNGWFMDPHGGVDALSAKVQSILALDKSELEEVTSEGQKSAIDRFGAPTYIEKLERLYKRCYERKK